MWRCPLRTVCTLFSFSIRRYLSDLRILTGTHSFRKPERLAPSRAPASSAISLSLVHYVPAPEDNIKLTPSRSASLPRTVGISLANPPTALLHAPYLCARSARNHAEPAWYGRGTHRKRISHTHLPDRGKTPSRITRWSNSSPRSQWAAYRSLCPNLALLPQSCTSRCTQVRGH